MTEQQERRLPNWVVDEEQHMRIKRERQLLDYQIRFFTGERNRMQKRLDKLNEGQKRRAETYGITYHSRKELDDAYMVGAIDDHEYMRQRSNLWQVYSDRGYIARIEWLDKMINEHQAKMDAITEWMDQKREESKRAKTRRWLQKKHKAAYYRMWRRKKRSEREKAEYKERKERCKYVYR